MRVIGAPDGSQIIECPSCIGTGRNRRGGPCKRCGTTGRIEQTGFFMPAGLGIASLWFPAIRLFRRWLDSDPESGIRRDQPRD